MSITLSGYLPQHPIHDHAGGLQLHLLVGPLVGGYVYEYLHGPHQVLAEELVSGQHPALYELLMHRSADDLGSWLLSL